METESSSLVSIFFVLFLEYCKAIWLDIFVSRIVHYLIVLVYTYHLLRTTAVNRRVDYPSTSGNFVESMSGIWNEGWHIDYLISRKDKPLINSFFVWIREDENKENALDPRQMNQRKLYKYIYFNCIYQESWKNR